ncbi:hypothetical protein SAMN05421863_103332 [Nitrosomonas communis]|uniref:Uncharacterized protein n=1 Tax=Nitrosomonas communis TaxID=44574 RepID=A0A1I4RKQ4_9PROT|nr:hypothetical protein SAMN05421863_103332 [Nitrosomonas communis]
MQNDLHAITYPRATESARDDYPHARPATAPQRPTMRARKASLRPTLPKTAGAGRGRQAHNPPHLPFAYPVFRRFARFILADTLLAADVSLDLV